MALSDLLDALNMKVVSHYWTTVLSVGSSLSTSFILLFLYIWIVKVLLYYFNDFSFFYSYTEQFHPKLEDRSLIFISSINVSIIDQDTIWIRCFLIHKCGPLAPGLKSLYIH